MDAESDVTTAQLSIVRMKIEEETEGVKKYEGKSRERSEERLDDDHQGQQIKNSSHEESSYENLKENVSLSSQIFEKADSCHHVIDVCNMGIERVQSAIEMGEIQCQDHSHLQLACCYTMEQSSPLNVACSKSVSLHDDAVTVKYAQIQETQRTMQREPTSKGELIHDDRSTCPKIEGELESVKITEREIYNQAPIVLYVDEKSITKSNSSGSLQESPTLDESSKSIEQTKMIEHKVNDQSKLDIDSIFSTDDDESDKSLSIFPEKLYCDSPTSCHNYSCASDDLEEDVFLSIPCDDDGKSNDRSESPSSINLNAFMSNHSVSDVQDDYMSEPHKNPSLIPEDKSVRQEITKFSVKVENLVTEQSEIGSRSYKCDSIQTGTDEEEDDLSSNQDISTENDAIINKKVHLDDSFLYTSNDKCSLDISTKENRPMIESILRSDDDCDMSKEILVKQTNNRTNSNNSVHNLTRIVELKNRVEAEEETTSSLSSCKNSEHRVEIQSELERECSEDDKDRDAVKNNEESWQNSYNQILESKIDKKINQMDEVTNSGDDNQKSKHFTLPVECLDEDSFDVEIGNINRSKLGEDEESSPDSSPEPKSNLLLDCFADSDGKSDDDVSTCTEVDSDVTPSRESIPEEVSDIIPELSFYHTCKSGKIMEEDTIPDGTVDIKETRASSQDFSKCSTAEDFWPPTSFDGEKPNQSRIRRNNSSPETCPQPAAGSNLTRSHSFIRRNVSSPSLRSFDTNDGTVKSKLLKASRLSSSRSAIHLWKLTERPSEVAIRTESAIGSLYEPFEDVKIQLVRQAREVLLCRYQGDYWKFCQRFLQPVSLLLNELKSKVQCRSNCIQKSKGWPLHFNRRVLIHLGELDEAILKCGDFYFCLQETDSGVALLIKYWTENRIDQRVIHAPQYSFLFSMDWLEGYTAQDTSDEKLSTFLQHLLVSVERGIERLEWKSVVRPWTCDHIYSSCCPVGQVDVKDNSIQAATDGETTKKHSCQQHPEEEVEGKISETGKDNENRISSDGCQNDQTTLRSNSIGQVNQDILHSGVAYLPGSRDMKGRSMVVIFGTLLQQKIAPSELCQLLAYYHAVPTREVIRRGFLVLVDGRGAPKDVWTILDDTFRLLQNIIPNCISLVLLWKVDNDYKVTFPSSEMKFETVNDREKLLTYVKEEQLLSEFGGKYVYDHQEWISFRKFLEPFVSNCRISGRHLVRVMQTLKANQLPSSSTVTHNLIEEQKSHINKTFHDDQLRHLEEEGDAILKELESYGTQSPHNTDYRECLEKTSNLYGELRKSMGKLAKLADKRLTRLEECLQVKMLEEESSQVLTWLCRKGEEMLSKHQAVADSLGGIKDQEEEFEKFYFVAMTQIEKGNDLLEEAAMMGIEALAEAPNVSPETPNESKNGNIGVHELTTSLKNHLNSFTDRLEDTRERLEDTAKCYHLLDKTYEWALETMRFVSHMTMDNLTNPEVLNELIKHLQDYMDDHPVIPEETFQEMTDIALKLENERLVDQCKTAHTRCQETVELIQTRLTTLQKVKHQLESESCQQLWDEDEAPTPRTSRSKSHPGTLWVPHLSSTPFHPNSLVQPFCQRRSSLATMVSQSYSSSIGSYTSFPSNYYLIVDHKDNHQIDYYLPDKEQQIFSHGLITDDLTTQGPVASIPRTLLEARSIRTGASSTLSSNTKSNISNSCSSKTNSLDSETCSHISIPYLQPVKKYLKRGHTWQMCEEALERAKKEVKQQNERLKIKKVLPGTSGSSNESITSIPENDDSRISENCSRMPLTHTQSDPLKGPVPVNSHLLTRASSLELQDASVTDGQINEDQIKTKKTLMLIMREMIQTERDYVKSLEYIIENYIPELSREDIPQALRGHRNTIFSNIEKIYEFHNQYFLQELTQSENIPFSVGQCFLRYEPKLNLYALYNKNKPKSDALMSEYGTQFFRKKQLELGDKMDLASYLLKPVQRMGKYALLLKQLLKECPERDAEYQDLKAAEELVRFQLRHGNDLLAMDALRDCDVNVKEQGQLLRQDEFLVWQGRSRKSLRRVFLFEDLILFSKTRRDPERKGHEIYQYKHSIKTTDIGLTEQIGDSPTKFEIWFRKRKLNDVYILQAPTAEIKIAWSQEISKLLWKQALRNRELRLAEMSSMGIGNKPCLDIKPSEDQINDRSVNIQQLVKNHRFRNSIAVSSFDQLRNKRPHSIISVSSSSSSGSSQSSLPFYGALNLGFEPGDSPRPLHRSLTQQSQCSTESGFCTDVSLAGDSPPDTEHIKHHKKAERSDSLLSSDSLLLEVGEAEFISSTDSEQALSQNVTASM
ncbi:uncharacterized protein [Centruroides vittatus]